MMNQLLAITIIFVEKQQVLFHDTYKHLYSTIPGFSTNPGFFAFEA